jgi:hypothetical protein
MGPLDGHFFCDLVSRRLLLETAVPVVGWIERCKIPNTDQQGAWLVDDALAPGLTDVLGVMGRDAVPVLLDVLGEVETWADQRPDYLEKPPRAVGLCKTSLRGTGLERVAMAYTLFSVQQVLDVYASTPASDRARVDVALAGTGWEELLAYSPRHRLCKQGFELAFEPSRGGGGA